MSLRIRWSFLALAAATWPAVGDEPAPTARKVIVVAETEEEKAPPADRLPDTAELAPNPLAGACTVDCCTPGPRLWVEGAVLCWWVKDGPSRFPLVTTGNPADGPT